MTFNFPKNIVNSLLSVLFPPLCAVCGETLNEKEEHFCLSCFRKLPYTSYAKIADNEAFIRFMGKIPIEKASSFLFYNKGGIGQKIVGEIKYHGNIRLGKYFGAFMAEKMLSTGFFEHIDCLVPVPLHRSKQKKRGFNQAEVIASGISAATGIPVISDNVVRKKATSTQTRKGIFERWLNTKEIFEVKNPEIFDNKQVMIIDDVLTTGSTLEAVAACILQKAKGVKIHILTLAIA